MMSHNPDHCLPTSEQIKIYFESLDVSIIVEHSLKAHVLDTY